MSMLNPAVEAIRRAAMVSFMVEIRFIRRRSGMWRKRGGINTPLIASPKLLQGGVRGKIEGQVEVIGSPMISRRLLV
jgi:hypothetical protein